jgi:hypothetical protein
VSDSLIHRFRLRICGRICAAGLLGGYTVVANN